ncbi:MAG: TraR/DksA C4-type zinc finger protein [Chromatiales bacterium]|nr:TraR/DksA C4-type zinc finger protein [Gammaproteobacteria bacterium]MBW6477758.1 TraR/DksA C4-type zinc finger protein [Chromatiales bacterium]
MSDLNETQLAALKLLLQEHRQQLRADIRDELLRKDSEQYGELAGQVHDAGEESVADMLVELNAAVLGQSIRTLREVEAAQQRLAEGHYGRCVDCDEPIPFERLRVYPSATRCLVHQEAFEQGA